MQGEGDRDRAIDQALRHTFRTPMSTPPARTTGECVDADGLAAWSEGTLSSDRAAAVESHLSECARCQQMLAMFARTSPEPVVPEPLWRRWRLQWLVPIAAAATAAAIWVASPRQDQTSVSPPVSDSAAPSNAPSSSTAKPDERAEPAREAARPEAAARPRSASESESKLRQRVAEEPAPPAALAATPPEPKSLQKSETLERRDAAVGTVQPAPQAQAEADTDLRARANDAFSPQPEAPDKRASSPPAAGAAAPTAAPAPVSPAPSAARSGVRALGTAARFVGGAEIPSPNPQIRWRIGGGGQVERTTNGGAQWQPATIPAAGALTAGVSPSSSVCWIVGRAGAVYVTADGLRFVRVNFPEPIDLVSVTATDDRHATVMSADGRSFSTRDRGANWTP